MTGLELVLAVVGIAVTIMVVVGMVLIVPGGVEAAPVHTADPEPLDADTGTSDLRVPPVLDAS